MTAPDPASYNLHKQKQYRMRNERSMIGLLHCNDAKLYLKLSIIFKRKLRYTMTFIMAPMPSTAKCVLMTPKLGLSCFYKCVYHIPLRWLNNKPQTEQQLIPTDFQAQKPLFVMWLNKDTNVIVSYGPVASKMIVFTCELYKSLGYKKTNYHKYASRSKTIFYFLSR